MICQREMINQTIERYGVLTWKTCVLFENYKWCIFYCGQKPSCNFFCPQNDCSYFHNAIAMWRNSGTPQPKCREHKKLTMI